MIVAQSIACEGSAYQDLRSDTIAEALYRKSIAIERARGNSATDIALAFMLGNLGVLLRRRGDLRGADSAQREAPLAIRRARLAPNSPGIVQSLSKLAVAVEAPGDRVGALQRYQEAIAIQTANASASDASVVTMLNAVKRLVAQ